VKDLVFRAYRAGARTVSVHVSCSRIGAALFHLRDNCAST
jgi:ribosomal protein L37E